MASNAKLRDQARLLEQKENWREAIAAYRQVLENPEGENDIGLWNRVGDMHARLGETDRAVEAYDTAVSAYAEAGLHNNAIALCRKILRLVPGRAAVYLKLGQIYAAKGFFADARQNFLEFAERMQRAGKLDASFDALREFADLSPTDTDVRRLLADQLVSHGRTEQAVEQFRILIAQAEERRDDGGAEELRAQIRAIDPEADTSPLVRASRASGDDDFHAAFSLDARPSAPASAAAPPPPAAQPPAGLDNGPGGEISLGEITPLAGLELTSLDDAPSAPPPPPPAAPAAAEEGLSLDFHIEPLDITPTAEPPGGPPPELAVPGAGRDDDAEDDSAGLEPLPLMDVDDFGPPPSSAGTVEGLETHFDGFSTLDEDDEAEPLPLMDFGAVPLPAVPAAPPRDRLEVLRERFAADPADGRAREELLEALGERGLAYEGESLLEDAHRALSARGEWDAALETVGALLALRPGDGALLQKQVEYAFRSGGRERLVPAYVALGEHLLSTGEASKGQAVFKRVQELDPGNARAREVLAPAPRPAAAPPPPPLPAAPAAGGDYIDLGSLILDEDRSEPSTRFVVEEREPTGDEDRDFADMLQHFRQKVAENIEVEDSGSHYDLGLAFKEMGLLDEAIAEFQVALRGGANPLATLELLGQCFVEKGQFAVAARVLDRALRITGATDNELIGVLYQLGRTEEAMGHRDAARDLFERVLSIDIRFRDAARRADALRAASGA